MRRASGSTTFPVLVPRSLFARSWSRKAPRVLRNSAANSMRRSSHPQFLKCIRQEEYRPENFGGKSRASGNARRHGWAAAKSVPSTVQADVEQMVQAICGDHASPALYEQAVIIAECEIALLKLRADRVAIIERHRIIEQKPERANQRLDVFLNEELALALETE